MTTINNIYREICWSLLSQGKKVGNTLELNNVSFKLNDISENIVGIRDISKSYLFGELVWYFAARNDVEFISKFASMWSRITDDGKTNNSAYGDIVFKRHGFDQVEKIIELLKADPESRRAVINFNVPNENVIETKDEICTICLQFIIRDNQLHCTAVMRSNDVWFGLPYDVVFFTELQKFIAHRVGVEYGTYTHYVTSLHVYDNFVDKVKDVLTKHCEPILHIDIEKLVANVKDVEKEIMESSDPKKDIIKIFERLNIVKEKIYEN